RAERLRAAPAYVQRSLLAPYLAGMAFLMRGNATALLQGVAAADVDRAFRAPPATTEQVLHPAQYWGAETPPRAPQLPPFDPAAALGGGWQVEYQNTLGELGLAVLTAPDSTGLEALMQV